MKIKTICLSVFFLTASSPALAGAEATSAEHGKKVHAEHCYKCHASFVSKCGSRTLNKLKGVAKYQTYKFWLAHPVYIREIFICWVYVNQHLV